MSVLASAQVPTGRSDNGPAYYNCLLLHAHVILHMGYKRLDSCEFSTAEEEDITGVLSDAMTDALASPESPAWRFFYTVHEEPRVRNKKRRGKRRLRLDIQVEYTGEARPRFSFEAKRLRASDPKSISKYLGEEGLGCFILGLYARESDEVGMLAYVQSDDHEQWASSIRAGLHTHVQKCEWKTEDGWVSVQIAEGLTTTFKSSHARSSLNKGLTVYHTLLAFLPRS